MKLEERQQAFINKVSLLRCSGKGHENIGIAADIPQNKPLRMQLLKGKGHENGGIAAGIPKKIKQVSL